MSPKFIFTLIFMLLLLLNSCADEKDNPTAPNNLDSKLIGEWIYQDSNNETFTWTFKEDGSCIQTIYSQTYNWKWEIEGEKIKLYVEGGTPTFKKYKIEGNKLYMWVDAINDWGLPFIKS